LQADGLSTSAPVYPLENHPQSAYIQEGTRLKAQGARHKAHGTRRTEYHFLYVLALRLASEAFYCAVLIVDFLQIHQI
jgi:hypothetical protein